jgi:ribonuclease HI
MHAMETLTAYTDGSSLGNPGPAGWGVLYSDGREFSGDLIGTNNQAELMAAWMAVENAPRGCQLEIATDSKLVIGWLSQGWNVQHLHIAQLIACFHNAVQSNDVEVTFRKVKGHASDVNNNYVDSSSRIEARELELELYG